MQVKLLEVKTMQLIVLTIAKKWVKLQNASVRPVKAPESNTGDYLIMIYLKIKMLLHILKSNSKVVKMPKTKKVLISPPMNTICV